MTKKQTELSEELREAVFEAARAGAAEAYTQNTGYVNYFKAMETLLYNYKKLAALVADEEAYCEVEYWWLRTPLSSDATTSATSIRTAL